MSTEADPRSVQEELARRRLDSLAEAAEHSAYAFALLHMRTERRQFLSFRERPYLVDILQDDRPKHVCVACAQSGKTMTYKSKVWWRLLYPGAKARTAIYTFPTQGDVEEFSAARAKAMIEASPLLSEQMGDIDKVSLKQFKNGSTIYYRGTWSQRQAISIPADILCHDELDKSQPDTLQMYSDRLRASDDPRTYLFSTPTIPPTGSAPRGSGRTSGSGSSLVVPADSGNASRRWTVATHGGSTWTSTPVSSAACSAMRN